MKYDLRNGRVLKASLELVRRLSVLRAAAHSHWTVQMTQNRWVCVGGCCSMPPIYDAVEWCRPFRLCCISWCLNLWTAWRKIDRWICRLRAGHNGCYEPPTLLQKHTQIPSGCHLIIAHHSIPLGWLQQFDTGYIAAKRSSVSMWEVLQTEAHATQRTRSGFSA